MQWQPSTSPASQATIARALLIFLVALFASFAIARPASAQSFPAFTGLVTDAANVLSADRKAALEVRLEAFQQQTGRQLVVATIPDLQGYAIEDYGYRLGRSWGVGLKGADNGAILIVAPNERKVRIEVGYKLEPVLTDAFSSVVIQEKVLPAFKAGDMPGGIDAGADALIRQLSLPDDQAKAQVAKASVAFDEAHKRSRSSRSGAPFGMIFLGLVVGFVLLSRLRGRGGARRFDGGGGDGGGGGSNWPIWLWAASEIANSSRHSGSSGGIFGGGDGGGSDGSWGGGGFTGGGGGDFGGGGASGSW